MTKIIGHRGARGLWPENSLVGFRRVAGLGVDAVEFDVHRSDAGELLLLHDPLLERTTDGSGPVRALTPDGRKGLRLNDSSETIPTLREVLDVLAVAAPELHVEIKNDETGQPYPGLVAAVLAEIDRLALRPRCHLASFDPVVLDQCRQAAPDVARLISVDAGWLERHGGLGHFLDLAEELADLVAVHHRILDEHWAPICSRVPLPRLCVWTVDDVDEIRRWCDRGVGYLTSDRPDLAVQIRAGGTGGPKPAAPRPAGRLGSSTS